jgi:hypothetical protein
MIKDDEERKEGKQRGNSDGRKESKEGTQMKGRMDFPHSPSSPRSHNIINQK